MSNQNHKRHTELHEALDELVACYFLHTQKLFSQSTVMELMQWSSQQMQKEQDGESLPCAENKP